MRQVSTNKVEITYQGQIRILADWARILGFEYSTLRTRIKRDGMSFEEVISKPVRRVRRPSKMKGEDSSTKFLEVFQEGRQIDFNEWRKSLNRRWRYVD